MELRLYYNASENNQLVKDIVYIATLTGTLRDASNIVKPSILIERADLGTFNYVYISEFNRYYYVKEIESYRTSLWLLTLESDPLMSFKSSILELSVILKETENTGLNNYLLDDRVWRSTVKDKTDIIKFPNGLLENGEYILITSGGVV